MGQLAIVHQQEVYYEFHGSEGAPLIVCLHGFTGSTATWSVIADTLKEDFHVCLVDLMGHGQSAKPTNTDYYTMERQIEVLDALFDDLSIKKCILLGYSMGGRIALSYALTHPNRVTQLILESASPGLKTETERIQRREKDARLATSIEQNGIEAFVDFWEDIPLFHTQKKLSVKQQEAVRTERLSQSVIGLTRSLKGIGTGSQPSNWKRLSSLELPVLLLTGALDQKFIEINRQMQQLLPNAKHHTIEDVGHAIHVENPILFATIVKEYIISKK